MGVLIRTFSRKFGSLVKNATGNSQNLQANYSNQLLKASVRSFSVSKQSSAEADLVVTIESGVKTIRLNRPTARNAINTQMYKDLAQTLYDSNKDETTVVNVITGTGDFFCSGNDMGDFRDNTLEPDIEKKKIWQQIFEKFVCSLIDAEKPVIALVNGPAVGIGVTALGLADVVYSIDKAYFITPFSQLGICPEACSSHTFPSIMGYGKGNEMITFGKRFTAAEAQSCGLVTEVFASDAFSSETNKRVKAYAQLPVKSLVYSKELVRGPSRELLHAVNKREGVANFALRETKFHKDAIMSFFNKSKK